MTTFSYGLIDGSQTLRPTHRDDRFEMLDIDSAKRHPLPIPYRGMTLGSGAATKPPASLEDGVFLALGNKPNTANSGYGTNPFQPVGAPAGSSIAHGTSFYDIAANANTTPVYMVYTANTASIVGTDNPYFLNDADGLPTVVKNPLYTPGEFSSEACTGVTGSFRCWIPAKLTSEVSLGGYNPGDQLTILNGRVTKATTGDMVVGRVEIKDTLKMLVFLDLSNPHKLQA